jgi:1,4-dihydroxy-2-naphthoate polyprenyltransferase
MPKPKILFLETRPQFLLLSVVLVFLGVCMSWYYGFFNLWDAILSVVGLLLLHASTNVLNDYFDYKSGVDLKTKRTPFSGGSGLLPAKVLNPGQVLTFGIICFLIAVPIGVYFVLTRGWGLLPLLVVGAFCVVLYTPLLTRVYWPELWAGIGLGTLPVLGAFFVQTSAYTLPAVIACIPSGILVHNLLFLNEFPDIEADRSAGKKTLPITAGRHRAALIYSGFVILTYVWIVAGVIAHMLPLPTLLGLLTLPMGLKAINSSLHSDDLGKLVSGLGANVMVVLVTQLLMGFGYIIAKLVGW